ncbi:MAG TPA: hypothetical protein VH253_01510 [Phycisphaerae bacterium]|nr:hypothetical protein [Phycisphaerae bacterium]
MDLTPEQLAVLEKYCGPHHYGEQDENGVDLSLIRHNLRLSTEERLARASRARRDALRLREIGRRARENRA